MDMVGLALEDSNAPRPPWVESPVELLCASAGQIEALLRWCPYLIGGPDGMTGLRCALAAATFGRDGSALATFLQGTGYEVRPTDDGRFEIDLRAMSNTAYLHIAHDVDLSDHGVFGGLAPRSVNPRTARRSATEDASWRIATASVRFPIDGHVETIVRGEPCGTLPFRGEGAIDLGTTSIERLSFMATATGEGLGEIDGPSRLVVGLDQHRHDLVWTFRQLQID
jgi:hypothetical protein